MPDVNGIAIGAIDLKHSTVSLGKDVRPNISNQEPHVIQIKSALKASAVDWSSIDPSIPGALFERGLDPGKRSQPGAHSMGRNKIMRIVDPVIVRPLPAEWKTAKARIAGSLERTCPAKSQDTAARHTGPGRPAQGVSRRNRATTCGGHPGVRPRGNGFLTRPTD